jgi:hypothetical protein
MAAGRNSILLRPNSCRQVRSAFAEVPLTSVYVQDGIIHIADEKIKLPIQLMRRRSLLLMNYPI